MKSIRLSKRPAVHLVAIAGVGIVLTLPVLILGVPLFSDDGVTHAMWYTHFSGQLWSGDFYPRWLMNMNSGLGSPVFFYYPPVPFFLTSLLRPLFTNDSQGWHQVGVSCSIAIIASGFAAYLWLKDIGDHFSAMVAAVLYMAMPYHLGDVYVRGSLSEIWAFVWMPLILFFTNRIVHGRRLAPPSRFGTSFTSPALPAPASTPIRYFVHNPQAGPRRDRSQARPSQARSVHRSRKLGTSFTPRLGTSFTETRYIVHIFARNPLSPNGNPAP